MWCVRGRYSTVLSYSGTYKGSAAVLPPHSSSHSSSGDFCPMLCCSPEGEAECVDDGGEDAGALVEESLLPDQRTPSLTRRSG